MASFYLVCAFCLNAAANILLKLGASQGLALGNWQLGLGAALFALNLGCYTLALRALPLSVAYPVMVGMSFLIVNGYALLYLTEAITLLQIVGYALIIAGVVLASGLLRA